MRWLIVCTCGHKFTRATICRRDLRTWRCPRQTRDHQSKYHQTHGERPAA